MNTLLDEKIKNYRAKLADPDLKADHEFFQKQLDKLLAQKAAESKPENTDLDKKIEKYRAKLSDPELKADHDFFQTQLDKLLAKKAEQTPKVEKTTPKVEKTTPKVEKTTPKVEKTTPKVEKTTPKVENPAPPLTTTGDDVKTTGKKRKAPKPKTRKKKANTKRKTASKTKGTTAKPKKQTTVPTETQTPKVKTPKAKTTTASPKASKEPKPKTMAQLMAIYKKERPNTGDVQHREGAKTFGNGTRVKVLSIVQPTYGIIVDEVVKDTYAVLLDDGLEILQNPHELKVSDKPMPEASHMNPATINKSIIVAREDGKIAERILRLAGTEEKPKAVNKATLQKLVNDVAELKKGYDNKRLYPTAFAVVEKIGAKMSKGDNKKENLAITTETRNKLKEIVESSKYRMNVHIAMLNGLNGLSTETETELGRLPNRYRAIYSTDKKNADKVYFATKHTEDKSGDPSLWGANSPLLNTEEFTEDSKNEAIEKVQRWADKDGHKYLLTMPGAKEIDTHKDLVITPKKKGIMNLFR